MAAPPAAPLPLRFDIEVLVPSTLRVENNLARLVASADLQLRGTYDRPLLFGRAEVDRGEVTFEGRRYLVTQGTIDFTNPLRIEPFFDVEAETRVRVPGQTYRVTVRAAGTMERLQPTLSPIRRCRPPTCWRCSSATSAANRQTTAELRALRRIRTSCEADILTTRATQLLANPDLVGGRARGRADLRRRHVPALAVAHRSVSPRPRPPASTRRRASPSASAFPIAST